MRSSAIITTAAACVITLAGTFGGMSMATAGASSSVDFGKKTAFNRKKGNCLACHAIAGGVSPGDIGPPLVAMKARFPDRNKLRAQIWDATANNPNSRMIPFGRHKVLSEKEIDAVVDFLYTL